MELVLYYVVLYLQKFDYYIIVESLQNWEILVLLKAVFHNIAKGSIVVHLQGILLNHKENMVFYEETL